MINLRISTPYNRGDSTYPCLVTYLPRLKISLETKTTEQHPQAVMSHIA
jgi:hypothetical protein